ncbi:hypothetical protein SAMN02910358_01092 [Lachnospiraceae bacterium XBB1006]|nr:hypothetical protein SAMN02910358_01092 [Lachnospiraceae bacterium XBB1006]
MSAENNWEKVLKRIHVMISECPKVRGEQDKVVMDKQVLFEYLNLMSQCFYDMLDEYKLTVQQKKEAKYQMRKEYDNAVKNAESAAEDVYSASVMYTDEAITRLVRIVEQSKRSMEQISLEFQNKLQDEKNLLRANQKELQDVLFEMRDDQMYLSLINERRREIQEQKERLEKDKEAAYSGSMAAAYPKPEIKINKEYFEKMGLNEDGTPKPVEEKKVEAPEIKVDTNSNYFKWKAAQKTAQKTMQETELEEADLEATEDLSSLIAAEVSQIITAEEKKHGRK